MTTQLYESCSIKRCKFFALTCTSRTLRTPHVLNLINKYDHVLTKKAQNKRKRRRVQPVSGQSLMFENRQTINSCYSKRYVRLTIRIDDTILDLCSSCFQFHIKYLVRFQNQLGHIIVYIKRFAIVIYQVQESDIFFFEGFESDSSSTVTKLQK